MRRFLYLLIIALFMSLTLEAVQAQSDPDSTSFEIKYEETRRRLFSGAVESQFIERWRLLETGEGDIPLIRVNRISGQLNPTLRLYNNAGDLLAESVDNGFPDTDELIYEDGLSAAGAPYQIEVVVNNANYESFNPPEYSLTVLRDGVRRSNPNDGLSVALPDVGLEEPPELATGESQSISGLNIPIFGQSATFENLGGSQVLLQANNHELQINQSIPLSLGVRAITFLENGIGLSIRNDNIAINPSRRFFSDENFSVAFNDVTREYTFTMSSGMVIVTPFAQIESIEVRGGVAAFRVNIGDSTKRLLFDNQSVNVRRSGGDSINYTIVADGNTITSDLALLDTFASFMGQVRVYVGNDARFISDITSMNITANTNTGIQNISFSAPSLDSDTAGTVNLSIDWTRMSDILLEDEAITTITRNGTSATEAINNISAVLFNDGAVQFTRRDGTFRTVYPDGTDITTPTRLADNSDVLPYETGFRTRNYNNLGEDILPTCPCSNDVQAHTPINPANGNFFYSVNDFTTLGQSLALNLTRYYNSHDNRYSGGIAVDSRMSPRYLSSAPIPYPQFGNGWRHSYQYELDISGAPLGRITYLEPDGTGHYFFPSEDGIRWTSRTLLSMVFFRDGGTLGTWHAESTDGLRYYFDRVGRLTRISERNQSIIITPTPLYYSSLTGMNGVFVVGGYGRRLELYMGESGRIEMARDSELSQINYSYEGSNLVGVEYEPPTQSIVAVYQYSTFGLMIRYNDVRSPYTRVADIVYDPRNRVLEFTENPEGSLQRHYVYFYEDGDGEEERIVTRVFEVNGVRRRQVWTYNNLWQLINVSLPIEGWDYQFIYDATSGNLQSVRVPTEVSFNLTFDAWGNLTRFEDPGFTGESAYNFTYEQRGTRSLLTQIRYPNNRTDTFTWSQGDMPLLLSQEILIAVGAERVTRTTGFEYDEFGRLVMLTEPGNIATIYEYDSVGYVSAILAGIELEAGETRESITDTNRASSVSLFDYDLIGQLQQMTDARGLSYNIRWTRSGQVDSVNTSTGALIDYSYDERGLLTNVNDRGQETIYTYNGLDLVIDVVDAADARQTFNYDAAGNVLSIVNGLGSTTTYQYDELDNLILQRTASGLLTRYTTTLNTVANAIIRTEIDQTGRVITRRYNFLGRLVRYSIRVDDAPENFQDYNLSYSSTGNLTSIEETQIGGRSLTLGYNLAGDVLSINVAGSETRFAYNARGLLSQVTSPAGLATSYEYDPLGNVSLVTMPDSTQWRYDYDGNSNLRLATDPLSLSTVYTPDELNRVISIVDPLGQEQSFSYDGRGNLASITDPDEINTLFTYDAMDRLSSITDGRGNTTSYVYDAIARLETINQTGVSDPTRITYDNDNNIIAITEQGQRTLYSYDALGRITSITDPLGHTTLYEYNPIGLVTRIQDALGNTELFSWSTGTNFLQGYTSESGQNYAINTDALGRVTLIRSVTEAVGEDQTAPQAIDTQVTYNADGYINSIQVGTLNARNNGINDRFYQFAYTPNGYPARYVDTLGGVWRLQYDDAGRLTDIFNPQDVQTQFQYDNAGRIIAVVNFVGEEAVEYTENYEYSRSGNITAYEIPSVIRNEYTYNPNNMLLRANLAVGTDNQVEYLFDYTAIGRLSRMFAPGGRETQYLYPPDAPNNLARYLSGSGDTQVDINFGYDAVGNLITVRRANAENEDINISYDSLDRRVRYVDSADNSWAYTYDAAGNIAQISDPLGSVISYRYDQYNRVVQIEYPSGSVVNLGYDEAGNLALVTLPTNTAGVSQRIEYDLNEIAQVESIQVGTNFIRFEYDAMGNITRRLAPDGTITTYTYDAAGRLTNTAYSNSDERLVYEYDTLGNLLSVGGIQFSYDVFGRMTHAEDGTALDYQYDPAGNLIERSSATLGTTTYLYDEIDRLEQINFEDQQVNVTYDEGGRIDQIIRAGSLTTAIEYDENDRIKRVIHTTPDGRIRRDWFTYFYDAVGNLIKVERVETRGEGATLELIITEVSYSYDIDQRLISERWLNADGETFYVVSYRYDNVGNRIEENRNGRVTTFTYNAQNQLTTEQRNVATDGSEFLMLPSLTMGLAAIVLLRRRRRWWILVPIISGLFVGVVFAQNNPQVTVEYEYDFNGNMTLIRYSREESYALDMDYDNENRLIAVRGQTIFFDEDGDEIGIDIDTHYTYDALSRVVGIATLEADYTLYYDGHTLIGMSNGETTERYLNFNGERLLTITGAGEILWNLNDRQGSTRRYADIDGNLVDHPSRRLEFGSFGMRIFPYDVDRIAPTGARISQPSQFFAGQLYDPSTRLYLMGIRAYDPIAGRFLQVDPIRQDPIGTLYTYARNRPHVFHDPIGMLVEPFTDPLNVGTLDNQIDPANLIPRPDTAPIPIVPSVHLLQSDETFRALQLLRATRFGVNRTVLHLSPLNDEIYLFELNPLPPEINSMLDDSLEQMISIYETGEGWIPDPRPNPAIAQNPFDALDDMIPTIARVYINPLAFNDNASVSLTLLPRVDLPDPLSTRETIEQDLTQLLQPIQPLFAFDIESDLLIALVPPTIEPTIPIPHVDLPTVLIEPPILNNLDALREQTYDFYSRIWAIGGSPCEDCVPPLGFSR